MLCMLVFGTQSAFADGLLGGTGTGINTIYDKDGIMKIETLGFAAPIYTGPTVDGEPEIEDLPDILMDGTLADKKNVLMYVSYRDICQNIKVAKRVDILRLDRRKAFAEFKANIPEYADAYVVVTVSNGTTKDDGTRLNIFYDVYNARTHQVVYAYRKLASKTAVRDALLYTEITKDFVNDLLSTRKDLIEEKEKEEKAILKIQKDAAKKAAKEAEKK